MVNDCGSYLETDQHKAITVRKIEWGQEEQAFEPTDLFYTDQRRQPVCQQFKNRCLFK